MTALGQKSFFWNTLILTSNYLYSTHNIVKDHSIKKDLSPRKKNVPQMQFPCRRSIGLRPKKARTLPSATKSEPAPMQTNINGLLDEWLMQGSGQSTVTWLPFVRWVGGVKKASGTLGKSRMFAFSSGGHFERETAVRL